jgi:N-carbamoylputrescine amidase
MEAPTGLKPESTIWDGIQEIINQASPDLLITNEMPFGEWCPARNAFDQSLANDWVEQHEQGLTALKALGAGKILSSRPVWGSSRLCNEAFLLTPDTYMAVHHKHFFPEEEGFYEATWFETQKPGFDTVDIGIIKAGVLLCTEVMFNEWARHYRRDGASLIAVSRAGGETMHHWHTAAKMAALTSGCYVVSSNRSGMGDDGQVFGGQGFAYDPNGELLGVTNHVNPVLTFDLDTELVKTRQREYPCYVRELSDQAP